LEQEYEVIKIEIIRFNQFPLGIKRGYWYFVWYIPLLECSK